MFLLILLVLTLMERTKARVLCGGVEGYVCVCLCVCVFMLCAVCAVYVYVCMCVYVYVFVCLLWHDYCISGGFPCIFSAPLG